MMLGERMARRNFLYVFAWLCAVVMPLVLQYVAGIIEEVREFMSYYYSDISLYMFFAMTYGFAAVFVSYYLIGGYRQAGTLDPLRVSRVKPWEVCTGVFLLLMKILVPPGLVFLGGFAAYMLFKGQNSFIAGQAWWVVVGMAEVVLANIVILAQVPGLGIFRRNSLLALLGVVLVLPVNIMPVVVVFINHWPAWAYGLLMIGVIGLLFGASVFSVTRLWPAQRLPAK